MEWDCVWNYRINADDVNVTVADNGTYSLWDYLEMPVDVIPAGAYPLDFWKRCYNMIYNEWFRDPNVMPPVDITSSNIVLNACWKKDYFTSMLPWQQRGTAQNLPVSLTGRALVNWTIGDGNVSVNSADYPLLKITDTQDHDGIALRAASSDGQQVVYSSEHLQMLTFLRSVQARLLSQIFVLHSRSRDGWNLMQGVQEEDMLSILKLITESLPMMIPFIVLCLLAAASVLLLFRKFSRPLLKAEKVLVASAVILSLLLVIIWVVSERMSLVS